MPTTPAAASDEDVLGFEDEDCVEISHETRVWGCPECGGKVFLVADGVGVCARCASGGKRDGGAAQGGSGVAAAQIDCR